MSSQRPVRPRPRRRRRRRAGLWTAVLVAVAFLAGLGLGEALENGPPSGTQTIVRTLRPLPLVPAAVTTVTVTTPSS